MIGPQGSARLPVMTHDDRETKALRVRISGRVQGVSFRAWTAEWAEALGISGWVRNEPDGTVAALIAGPEGAVDAMLSALQDGPPAARVTSVDADAAEPPEESGFRVTG